MGPYTSFRKAQAPFHRGVNVNCSQLFVLLCGQRGGRDIQRRGKGIITAVPYFSSTHMALIETLMYRQ